MASEDVATLFGITLIVALAALIAAMFRPSWRSAVASRALPLATAVAVGATAGSLYFSEVADFVPCELCWFQRIAMYPMALILPIAVWRSDRAVLRYAGALATAGLIVSAYHVRLQWFPTESNFCEFDNPCSARWVEAFGWLTIPQMAALSFVSIIILSALSIVAAERS